jgi:uridine kinase
LNTANARVILLAGPSGSGKSYIAHRTGLPVLCLDDFYRNGDEPGLPRTATGAVDWESPDSWDAAGAVAAVEELCQHGQTQTPVYAFGADHRIGQRTVDLGQTSNGPTRNKHLGRTRSGLAGNKHLGRPRNGLAGKKHLGRAELFVAEGIFAAEIVAACRDRQLLAGAYALHRPRGLTFVRRLARDLAQRRKPPAVLVRRGLALLRSEPAVLARAASLGARPASARTVLDEVSRLAASRSRA